VDLSALPHPRARVRLRCCPNKGARSPLALPLIRARKPHAQESRGDLSALPHTRARFCSGAAPLRARNWHFQGSPGMPLLSREISLRRPILGRAFVSGAAPMRARRRFVPESPGVPPHQPRDLFRTALPHLKGAHLRLRRCPNEGAQIALTTTILGATLINPSCKATKRLFEGAPNPCPANASSGECVNFPPNEFACGCLRAQLRSKKRNLMRELSRNTPHQPQPCDGKGATSCKR